MPARENQQDTMKKRDNCDPHIAHKEPVANLPKMSLQLHVLNQFEV